MFDSYSSTSVSSEDISSPVSQGFHDPLARVHKELTKTPLAESSSLRSFPIGVEVQNETVAIFRHVSAQFSRHDLEVTETKDIRELRPDRPSIYFRNEPISDDLRLAVHLLDQGRTFISAALENLQEGRVRDSDERVMDFKNYLPELFCLRTISESFGAVISAIQNALENRQGTLLNETLLMAVDEILKALILEPAMSFERAVEHVMRFEDAGFVVESQTLGGFLDLVEALENEFAPADDQR